MSGDPLHAADWCRASGVRRGSLVGIANQAAGYSFEVVRVTHVGRCLIVGSHVCMLLPRGRGLCGGPLVEGGADYEHSWAYASQLFVPPAELLDVVVAWMERGG